MKPTRTRPIFLYDADCGVCDQGVARMRERMQPDVDFVPYGEADLDALGVTVAECELSPVLVAVDGSHVAGPQAMAGVLRTAGRPQRMAAAVMSTPPVACLLDAVFPHLYRQRHRLPGGGDTCRVPAMEASS